MNLAFSQKEIIDSLHKIGYEIRHDTETVTEDKYGRDSTEEIKVYNAYYLGNRIDVFDAYWGFKRVQMTFEREVHKRILGLFEL
jgi:hypothetical protein